ncbi:MAG: 50S ribosomal protein L5 [Patescibacteria group bacterium]
MRLQEKYKKQILPALKEKFGYTNNLAVPRITKVTVNIGGGKFVKDSGFIEAAEDALKKITGQAPVKTKAKKSISSFKIREGMVIGLKVTLRKDRMFDFLEKLINITLPRVRDFRGLTAKAIDDQGNFNIGFSEHMAFPEVSPDDIDKVHGLEVCITTTARTKEEGVELFKLFGFPFKQPEEKNK